MAANWLIFSFSALICLTFAQICPQGYTDSPIGDACFYPVANVQNFSNCTQKCWLQRGILVKIRNAFENGIVQQMITQNLNGVPPYIGVQRQLNGDWVYSDGTPLTYKNWAPGQPSSSSNLTNCVIMDPRTGQWKATECVLQRTTVCSINTSDLPCPNRVWNFFDTTQQCYFVPDFKYNGGSHLFMYKFEESDAACQQINSRLASIHSSDEDQFVYGLVNTNMKNLSLSYGNPCDFAYAWIGLVGDGNWNSTWIDGSAFDYQGMNGMANDWLPWKIGYDEPCGISRWAPVSSSVGTARFVCKTSAKPR